MNWSKAWALNRGSRRLSRRGSVTALIGTLRNLATGWTGTTFRNVFPYANDSEARVAEVLYRPVSESSSAHSANAEGCVSGANGRISVGSSRGANLAKSPRAET